MVAAAKKAFGMVVPDGECKIAEQFRRAFLTPFCICANQKKSIAGVLQIRTQSANQIATVMKLSIRRNTKMTQAQGPAGRLVVLFARGHEVRTVFVEIDVTLKSQQG